jgi:hypothetical protein
MHATSTHKLQYRYRWVSLSALLGAILFVPAPSSAADSIVDAVRDWSAIASNVITAPPPMANRGGGAAAVDFAYVHAAIYDAVNAIDGSHTVFAVRPQTSAVGASPEAATAAAARTILNALFTTAAQQSYINTQYNDYLTRIPDGPAKTMGIAVGAEVANAFLALRSGDGRNANVPYQYKPLAPGVYQPTTDPPAAPATPWLAAMKPFAMKSPSQFRADGPPALTSEQWAEDYNEVRLWGVKDGSLRTQEETNIGWFYTDNPGAYYNRNIRAIAAEQGLTTVESARFFALIYITQGDAAIACWESKYKYNFWRPVTAIRHGDIDGNDATAPDPSWTPLAPTPTHPEYPSAHGCLTAAIAYSVEQYFGTKKITTNFTAFSVPGYPNGLTYTFDRTQDILKQVIEGRIFGGMHYRTSVVHGIVVGHKVSQLVSKHYFLPVDDEHGRGKSHSKKP